MIMSWSKDLLHIDTPERSIHSTKYVLIHFDPVGFVNDPTKTHSTIQKPTEIIIGEIQMRQLEVGGKRVADVLNRISS